MNYQLRKLNLLFRFTKLKPEMFYDINFSDGEIKLQGYKSADTERMVIALGFIMRFSRNGYFDAYRNGIEIILT